ncbi:hypothetical protein [Clostridium gelidum]
MMSLESIIVTLYGSQKSILIKTLKELEDLKDLGLSRYIWELKVAMMKF